MNRTMHQNRPSRSRPPTRPSTRPPTHAAGVHAPSRLLAAPLLTACSLTAALCFAPCAHAQWTVTRLGVGGQAADTGGGQQVGTIRVVENHASLWSGTPAPRVDLNPAPAWRSEAYGVGDGQQVGYASIGTQQRACLWTGTAASWVDLHPPGSGDLSWANDAGDGQQVGAAYFGNQLRAGLWTGTAASWVSLHPAGTVSSQAYACDDGYQVGSTEEATLVFYASLWHGTAESRVLLHPFGVGATGSAVLAIHGSQQGGSVAFGSGPRAALWRGSAASWVNLHPPGVGVSRIDGISESHQVGYAGQYACIWSGTPESCFNLHTLLPSGFNQSYATGISAHDGVLSVTGYGFNTMVNGYEALLWTRPLCVADFNSNDLVNSADFFDFLTAFFTLAPAADINHDTVVNSQDFFDFLASFFAGC